MTVEGVGDVLVERSERARRMSITVRASRVRVAVPVGVPLSRGRDFALSRVDWIRRHLERMRCMAVARRGERGGPAPLRDIPGARQKIIDRLAELSDLFALPYRGVTIRSQKTRWGSCSGAGTLSLNINLARLPDVLMDYVILHELVHTRVRGHGSLFWKRLEMLIADARGLRRELGRYGFLLD